MRVWWEAGWCDFSDFFVLFIVEFLHEFVESFGEDLMKF